MRLAGDLLILWSAAAMTGCAVLHAWVHAQWSGDDVAPESRRVGRHLLWFMVAFAAVLDLWGVGVVLRWLGFEQPAGFQALRLVVFAAVPVVITQRLLLQIRALRPGRRVAPPS